MRKNMISLPAIHIDKAALRQRIGQRIRERREAMQISQAALAAACGIDRTRLSRIETGKGGMSAESAAVLATALEVNPDDLLGERGSDV